MPMTSDTLVFVISQSGETADTLAALRESQRKGHRTLGICNNVASTIARESDGGVYMHAGPEIGVAATKSFTSQVTILTLLALLLGRIHHLSYAEGSEIIDELEKLPDKVAEDARAQRSDQAIARKYAHAKDLLFMGRQVQLPDRPGRRAEDEGDQLHSRSRPSERRAQARRHRAHQPGAALASSSRRDDAVFEKNLSNIEEVKARKGPVIAVGTEGDQRSPRSRTTSFTSRRPRLPHADPRRHSRCNCWPTTSPSSSAATWTSRETSPRA